ncbi:MAG: hypothetical protein E5Y04_28830 [Mesorhizobium sp.]|nr:MAG: hypothetical protein E5Y04_28830 [Mesorhizobium sp.]
MDVIMRARGASPEEIQRGLEAAKTVLDRAGVTAEQAAGGAFAVEDWDEMGFPADQEPSEMEYAAADVWYEANTAALQACCQDWPQEKRLRAFGLELLTNPEVQLADRDTALAKLRALTDVEDGRGEFLNSEIGMLADALAVDLDNPRDLIAALTIAFTTLELSGFHPDEPIEPKRQAVYEAIDALEAATAMPTSH